MRSEKIKALKDILVLTRGAISDLKSATPEDGITSATIYWTNGSKTFNSVEEAETFMNRLKKTIYGK
jgi:hypothetical protein